MIQTMRPDWNWHLPTKKTIHVTKSPELHSTYNGTSCCICWSWVNIDKTSQSGSSIAQMPTSITDFCLLLFQEISDSSCPPTFFSIASTMIGHMRNRAHSFSHCVQKAQTVTDNNNKKNAGSVMEHHEHFILERHNANPSWLQQFGSLLENQKKSREREQKGTNHATLETLVTIALNRMCCLGNSRSAASNFSSHSQIRVVASKPCQTEHFFDIRKCQVVQLKAK